MCLLEIWTGYIDFSSERLIAPAVKNLLGQLIELLPHRPAVLFTGNCREGMMLVKRE